MNDAECKHNKAHKAIVNVHYLEDSQRFSAEILIECADCGRKFQFMGLPLGLDLNGATMSVNAQTAILSIAPEGRVPSPMDAALLAGYRIRMPGDH